MLKIFKTGCEYNLLLLFYVVSNKLFKYVFDYIIYGANLRGLLIYYWLIEKNLQKSTDKHIAKYFQF